MTTVSLRSVCTRADPARKARSAPGAEDSQATPDGPDACRIRRRQGLFCRQHDGTRIHSFVRGSDWQTTCPMATKSRLFNLGRSFSRRPVFGRPWAGFQWQHLDDREFLNRWKGILFHVTSTQLGSRWSEPTHCLNAKSRGARGVEKTELNRKVDSDHNHGGSSRTYVLHRTGCSQEDDQLLRQGCEWSSSPGRHSATRISNLC